MKTVFNMAGDAESVPLSALNPGEEGRIASIDSRDAIGRRLLDLGLVPQTRISLVRRAPLGDPSLYELCGYQLCLRKTEAERVQVTRKPPETAIAAPSPSDV